MRTPNELAERTSAAAVKLAGMVRRMAVKLTAKTLWQLVGFQLPDGSSEIVNAEPFLGFGIHARPATSGKPEAIAIQVGDARNMMIVGVRDEKTRAAVAGGIGDGETMLYNAVAIVYVKSDGTIEARSVGGVAHGLALTSELQALRDYVYNQFKLNSGHVHTVVGGATTTITASDGTGSPVPPTTIPANPVGTQKLKGE